jgi:hypothetical protein
MAYLIAFFDSVIQHKIRDVFNNSLYIRGAVKKLPEFFDIDGTLRISVRVTFHYSLL